MIGDRERQRRDHSGDREHDAIPPVQPIAGKDAERNQRDADDHAQSRIQPSDVVGWAEKADGDAGDKEGKGNQQERHLYEPELGQVRVLLHHELDVERRRSARDAKPVRIAAGEVHEGNPPQSADERRAAIEFENAIAGLQRAERWTVGVHLCDFEPASDAGADRPARSKFGAARQCKRMHGHRVCGQDRNGKDGDRPEGLRARW